MKWVFFLSGIVSAAVNAPLLYNLFYVHKFSGIRELWGYAPNAMLFYFVPFPFEKEIEVPMKWVFFLSGIVSAAVNAPLLYNLFYVHKFSGIRELWGYAPNAMLFYFVPFPFIALFTFYSMHAFIVELRPLCTGNSVLLWFLNNWITVVLMAASICSVVAAIDYLMGTRTYEKLHPDFSKKAVQYSEQIREDIEKYGTEKDFLKKLRISLSKKKGIIENIRSLPEEKRKSSILNLAPSEYLLIVDDVSDIEQLNFLKKKI